MIKVHSEDSPKNMFIKVLPAFNGDCILISFFDGEGKKRNILVDGGPPATYRRILKSIYNEIENDIDLLIITHIDDDHIGGIIKLFEDTTADKSKIKKIWFNSGGHLNRHFNQKEDVRRKIEIIPNDIVEMSQKQGNFLEEKLKGLGEVWEKTIIKQGHTIDLFDCMLTVLSPNEKTLEKLNKNWLKDTNLQINMSTESDVDIQSDIEALVKKSFKEDTGLPNGSSIAFYIEIGLIKGLLLGDAYPSLIEDGLRAMGFNENNKLKLEFVKISHHGSKGNTSQSFLNIIECKNFIISTNGSKNNLPHKESLARIIATFQDCNIFFNYKETSLKMFSAKDIKQYKFNIINFAKSNYTLNF